MYNIKILSNGKLYNAKIIHYDYDIGVTVVNADDENDYLICMHGPSSVAAKTSYWNKDRYDKIFKYLSYIIASNKVFDDDYILEHVYNGIHNKRYASSANCAFNQ